MPTSHTDFRPPHLNMSTVNLCWAALPLILRLAGDIVAVDVPSTDLERLKAMRSKRLVLTPNHPTICEPFVMFALSRAAQMPLHYLANRETFGDYFGLAGRLIQNLGGYSVVRGTADRESFRTTRQLLAAPAGKVVIFPEGEVYSQNDTLLPFHAGVVQIAFWALEDARKAGDGQADIGLLPVAVRYQFVQNMDEPIRQSLSGLERAVGLTAETGAEPYARLRQIGVAVLETMEAEYGLRRKVADAEDLTPRMEALKALLLNRAAALIGLPLSPEATLPERMRTLINAVYAVTHEEPEGTWPAYRERLHRQQAARVGPLMRDLNRVSNWIAVRDNYVRAHPTSERMADNLRRLEAEVFGAPRLRGLRRARVRLGEPIELAPCAAEYQVDKRATVARLTHRLEDAVQALLDTSADT
jgi:hypothetical protein